MFNFWLLNLQIILLTTAFTWLGWVMGYSLDEFSKYNPPYYRCNPGSTPWVNATVCNSAHTIEESPSIIFVNKMLFLDNDIEVYNCGQRPLLKRDKRITQNFVLTKVEGAAYDVLKIIFQLLILKKLSNAFHHYRCCYCIRLHTTNGSWLSTWWIWRVEIIVDTGFY